MPLDDLERKIQLVMAQTQRLRKPPEDPQNVAGDEEACDGSPPVHPVETDGAIVKENVTAPPPTPLPAPPPTPPVPPRSEMSDMRRGVASSHRKSKRERLESKRRQRHTERSDSPGPAGRESGFSPSITERGRRSSSSGPEARTEALYEYARAVNEKLEARREMERVSPSGCTYRPEISRRARSASPSGRSASGGVYERLHAAAEAREAERMRRKEAAERRTSEACTFKPAVKAGASRSGTVASRSAEFERNKERHLQAMREAQAALSAAEATFRPRVNNTAHNGTRRGSVWERLAAHDPAAERTATQNEAMRAEMAEYTFRPRINNRQAHSDADSETSAVHERLYDKSRELAARELERQARRAEAELADCSFRPRLKSGKSSTRGSQTRLLDDARDVAALRDELKRARELEGCTFSPSIGRSPRRSTDGPVYQRLAREDAGAKAAERGRLRATRELEGCTFKPRTGRSPSRPSDKPVFERMRDDESRRRARSLERVRRRDDDERRSLDQHQVKRSPSVERIDELATPRSNEGRDKRREIEVDRRRDLEKRPHSRSASPMRVEPDHGHPRRERSTARQPKIMPSTNCKSNADVTPKARQSDSDLDDFERWQAEMEAKLAAL